MDNLSGQIALVTGASRGIGAAVAEKLAARGAHVIALARTVGGLEALDDKIRTAGGSATLMPLDLMKLEDIDALGPAIMERFGRLDILIGNAAVLGTLTPVHQLAPKDWNKIMIVNFMANVRLVRTLDPMLRAAPAGRAIFTTADMVDKPMAYWGAYAASKAALEHFVRTYAAETAKTNLKAGFVRPGIVDTALLREAFPGGFPGKTISADEAAEKFMVLV